MAVQSFCTEPVVIQQVPGLFYIPGLLTEEESTALLAAVDAGPRGEADLTRLSSGRPVVTHPGIHWHGFPAAGASGSDKSSRSRRRANESLPTAKTAEIFCGSLEAAETVDLPDDTSEVAGHSRAALNRLRDRHLVPEDYCFDQAIINNYDDGKGIAAHVDRATFDDVIVGLSLGAPAVLQFTQASKKKDSKLTVPTTAGPNCASSVASSGAVFEPRCFELLLEPRSAYIMSGEARWRWCHGIPDGVPTISGVQLPFGRRVSVTFRRLRWRRSTTREHEQATMVDERAHTPDAGVIK